MQPSRAATSRLKARFQDVGEGESEGFCQSTSRSVDSAETTYHSADALHCSLPQYNIFVRKCCFQRATAKSKSQTGRNSGADRCISSSCSSCWILWPTDCKQCGLNPFYAGYLEFRLRLRICGGQARAMKATDRIIPQSSATNSLRTRGCLPCLDPVCAVQQRRLGPLCGQPEFWLFGFSRAWRSMGTTLKPRRCLKHIPYTCSTLASAKTRALLTQKP